MNTLDNDRSVFGKVNFLQAQDSRQYLFCLTPKPEAKQNPLAMKGVTHIGKMISQMSKIGGATMVPREK